MVAYASIGEIDQLATVKHFYLAVPLYWPYWRLRQNVLISVPPILYAELKRGLDKKEYPGTELQSFLKLKFILTLREMILRHDN